MKHNHTQSQDRVHVGRKAIAEDFVPIPEPEPVAPSMAPVIHVHVNQPTPEPTVATSVSARPSKRRQGVMPMPWYASSAGALWIFLMLAVLAGGAWGFMKLLKMGVL